MATKKSQNNTTLDANITSDDINNDAHNDSDEQPITPTAESNSNERDEFASSEYIDPLAKLPRIQALRGTSPTTCGYFITTKEMAKAGWGDYESIADQLLNYSFESSGKTEEGLLIQNPRMQVCPRSPLMAFDRAQSQESEQLVLLGNWKKEYKENENVGNCQLYEIILLNQDNTPLHTIPLSYIAKGANHATFSQHWQQLIQEVTTCHAIANGIAARPKNLKFNSLCVFSFQVIREQAGNKKKSFCCKVGSHEVPNMQNWKQFFVGFTEEMKVLTWENLQPERPLIIPSNEQLALPASVEEE